MLSVPTMGALTSGLEGTESKPVDLISGMTEVSVAHTGGEKVAGSALDLAIVAA